MNIMYLYTYKYTYTYMFFMLFIQIYLFTTSTIQLTIDDSIPFGKSEQRTARHAAQFRVLRYRDDSAIVAWLAVPRAELNSLVEFN